MQKKNNAIQRHNLVVFYSDHCQRNIVACPSTRERGPLLVLMCSACSFVKAQLVRLSLSPWAEQNTEMQLIFNRWLLRARTAKFTRL